MCFVSAIFEVCIVYPFTEVHCGTIISVYIVLAQYRQYYIHWVHLQFEPAPEIYI